MKAHRAPFMFAPWGIVRPGPRRDPDLTCWIPLLLGVWIRQTTLEWLIIGLWLSAFSLVAWWLFIALPAAAKV